MDNNIDNKSIIPIDNALPAIVKNTNAQLGIMKKILERRNEMLIAKIIEQDFTIDLGNGITLDMIFVEGGTFMMGSDDFGNDGKPVHSVTLDSFYIGKFQVTQAQWEAVMGNNPSEFHRGDDLPVQSVRWIDTQEFIEKINQKNLTNSQRVIFRLLTEAEWEYAAGGGNKSKGYKYAGSNNVDEIAWVEYNSGGRTHPVGQKKANELGIYDMSGNVWEWCEDWFDENYYKNSPNKNPKGATQGSYRVLRGGSWHGYSGNSRITCRSYDSPDFNMFFYGFRLCAFRQSVG